MITGIGKVALTGLACGALGLGLGGVWASQAGTARPEPMRTLLHPAPIAPAPEDDKSGVEARSHTESSTVVGQHVSPLAASVAEHVGQAEQRRVPGPRAQAGDEELQIKRLVVTDRIQEREPVAASELRADGSEVFAFVELSNVGTEEQRIEIVFEHESGQQVGFVKLPVPRDSTRWRTWGQTRQIKKSGRWVARVLSADGTELMSQSFSVGQG